MADHKDEILRALAHAISTAYTILVDVCGALPVPIGLPTDQHIPAEHAVPAIERVAEVALDQPMGELQTAQLYSGCIHLLAAIDLYALVAVRYKDSRADGCAANILRAEEALQALALWLMINEAD